MCWALPKARIPAVWSLHRIPGQAARQAVREFLDDAELDVRVAAIHSVGLWRDQAAVEPLVELLAGDEQQRRLAAMALGRIGDRRAVKSLLEAGSKGADAFLRHAIIYALYEIGDIQSLPEDDPVAKQVLRMHDVDRRNPTPHVMPKIQLADTLESDPDTLAKQQDRLRELAAWLPEGDVGRGQALFHNVAKSLCLTCHVMGDQGVKFGPDLTGIGSIRSERDLLEAIVYPSSSIARYYESMTVRTEEGETGGLVVADTVDKLILSAPPGRKCRFRFERSRRRSTRTSR